ncbi:MAG: methylenetetrahydrofolate reductase C-terminal domain-containing protein [Syntrophaceae bacterium]|nr:methylenetetrahydrofolate reductase C-terminal domain-containing protein [Syntrophaceae bacterium]
MNKTVWKPESEIDCLLKDYNTFGIFSCGTCANLSYTGGKTGIKIIKEHLFKNHKKVKLAKVILTCCPEEIMSQALQSNKKSLQKCDALIVLSCAGGIKSANSCQPGLPIINVLDSVGSAAVSCSDQILAHSLCKSCGNCVLTCTAGICPLSECPAKSKYEPCKSFSETNTKCAVDPQMDCIWHIIRARSKNLHLLPLLKEIHKRNDTRYVFPTPKKSKINIGKKFFAWFAARIQQLELVVRLFR